MKAYGQKRVETPFRFTRGGLPCTCCWRGIHKHKSRALKKRARQQGKKESV